METDSIHSLLRKFSVIAGEYNIGYEVVCAMSELEDFYVFISEETNEDTYFFYTSSVGCFCYSQQWE